MDSFNFKSNADFKYYLYWVSERMNIFWKRMNGEDPPWTDDVILQDYKFTNVYRCLDRVSQYLIKHIINNDDGYSDEDLFWRILLFKHFNKIETWEYLIKNLGDITYNTPMLDILQCLKKYKIKEYSGAFMLTASFMQNEEFKHSYGLVSGMSKYELYLRIFYKYFKEQNNTQFILSSQNQRILFLRLMHTPAFAEFLAMQYTDDLCWSRLFDFPDNTFISESLGSRRGINKTFDCGGECTYPLIIKWTHHNFEDLMSRFGYDFKPLPGRMPTLMDLQNCYCEVDKYLREVYKGSSGSRIKRKFAPTYEIINYEFPKKWNLKIDSSKQKINNQQFF